jgi:hypothetical protein
LLNVLTMRQQSPGEALPVVALPIRIGRGRSSIGNSDVAGTVSRERQRMKDARRLYRDRPNLGVVNLWLVRDTPPSRRNDPGPLPLLPVQPSVG